MTTRAEFRLPANALALGESFAQLPTLTVTMERSIAQQTPCLWLSGVERATLEATLTADATINSFRFINGGEQRFLYHITTAPGASLPSALLADDGSLLEATGGNGWWDLTIRFHDREGLCRAHDRLCEQGTQVDVRRVVEVGTPDSDRSKLTGRQREALAAACERGYFEIPRGISMQELATELGISHQALSERFRRAYATLVEDELQPATRARAAGKSQSRDESATAANATATTESESAAEHPAGSSWFVDS